MPIVLTPTVQQSTTLSFSNLVKELLERTGSGFQSVTTAAASSNLDIVDTEILDSYEPNTSYIGGYLRFLTFPLLGQLRRVGAYSSEQGILTVGRPYTSPVPSGIAYQFSELLSFSDLRKCINEALQEAYFRDRAYLPPPQVALNTLPDWIKERGQLVDILYGYSRSSDQGDLDLTPVKNWWWADQAGANPGQSYQTLVVGIDPIDQGATTMVIEAYRPFPTLLNDNDVTSMNLEWLMAGAKFHFYEFLIKRAARGDVARYEKLKNAELAKWNSHLWSMQPSDPTPLKFKYPYHRQGHTNQYPSWSSIT